MILPFFVGAGILAFLMAGGKKASAATSSGEVLPTSEPLNNELLSKGVAPSTAAELSSAVANDPDTAENKAKQKAAKTESLVALKEPTPDFQQAAAAALASRDESALEAVLSAMRKAGLKDEAETLDDAFDALLAADQEARDKARLARALADQKAKEAEAKKLAKKAQVEADKKKAAELAAQAAQKAKEAEAAKHEVKAVAEEVDPEDARLLALTKELQSHLASATRYKENREKVKAWQIDVELPGPDGLYGPASARATYDEFGLIPVNPYYWSSNSATRQKQLSDYQKFLASVKTERPDKAAQVDKLLATLGK
jgi:hypothetical protein